MVPGMAVPGVPMVAAVPRFSKRVKGVGAARGVDLSLDKFDLSAPDQMEPVDFQSAEACGAIGSAFWAGIDTDSESLFRPEDKALLRDVFNPNLSDRRDEADLFVPPDTSLTYVEGLRRLVKEEAAVMAMRKAHFFSSSFDPAEVGALYPSSWRASFEVQGKRSHDVVLHERKDYKAAAAVFEQAIKSAVPAFDKVTEEGTRFRIYRFGSVEVRTTQETNSKEEVGVIFSMRTAQQPSENGSWDAEEPVIKVTEFIQRMDCEGKPSALPRHHSYVVLETASGGKVVTERCADGTMVWAQDPADLEDRSSLAKIVRSADCSEVAVNVDKLKAYLQEESQCSFHGPTESKLYAQTVFCLASGTGADGNLSGFRRPASGNHWHLSLEGQGGWVGAKGQRQTRQSIRVRVAK